MKKILILAYDFPPSISVGGYRPYSWFEYFNKYGIHPVIITRQWQNHYGDKRDYISKSNFSFDITDETELGTIIRSPYKPNLSNKLLLKYGDSRLRILRKGITAFYEVFQHYFKIGPKVNLYFSAKKYLMNNKVDYIIATGDPFILFNYASCLSKKFSIPWYADYRDDWIQNHFSNINNSKLKHVITKLNRFNERRYLKNVVGFTSVSEYLVLQISKRTLININEVIENGADLKYYNTNNENPFPSNDFNIVYTGFLYDLNYLDDFWLAFEEFLRLNKFDHKIKLYFIGLNDEKNLAINSVRRYKKKYNDHIITLSRKSTSEIASYQSNANILLNLIAGDPEKGLIGAKSYNYAVTKNPILTIPNVKNKKSVFFPGRDIQYVAVNSLEICEFLTEHYSYFKNGEKWRSSITKNEIFMLSREYNAEKLVNFIQKPNGNIQ
jgi:hypothetical protein